MGKLDNNNSGKAIIGALKWGLFLLMSAMIVAVFMTPSPMSAAKALVTGDVSVDPAKIYRIMYFHVPQAMVCTVAFITGLFFAIMYLAKRDLDWDIKSYRANQVGLLFTVLALISGSIFARYTWGFWWDWSEIRMTSLFILALMYGGYFSLRSSLPDQEKRATLSAVMSALFTTAGIFLIFVAPRIAATRHPNDSIVDESGSATMSFAVAIIFWSSVVSFLGLFFWIWGQQVRLSRLEARRLSSDQQHLGVVPVVEDITGSTPT